MVLRDPRDHGQPCQFGGKLPAQVGGMVSGGRGQICEKCLDLSRAMLATGT